MEILDIEIDLILQMSFKIINDSIKFNDLVLILLIFGVYSRMIELNAPLSSIIQRIMIMKKNMNEIRKTNAIKRINNALNTRNGSSIESIHDLSLNSLVLIFCENNIDQAKQWKKLFKLINVQNESIFIDLSNDSIKFRTISIKLYYDDDNETIMNDLNTFSIQSNQSSINQNQALTPNQSIKRDRERFKKHFQNVNFVTSTSNVCFLMKNDVFTTENNLQKTQYTAFKQKEMFGLLKKNIFNVINVEDVLMSIRIFNSRFVNEIKHFEIDMIYEKSRLMIQTYNDLEKNLMLTQSSTIQRVSQRLIICLTAIIQNENSKLYLRNIIQIYVQSISDFNRDFYIRFFNELIILLNASFDCILKIIKSLYEIFETNNYWFVIYHIHHRNKLNMIESTYDSCFLYKTNFFGLMNMQTNDVLMLINDQFVIEKKNAIKKTKLMIKNREHLIFQRSIKFNEIQIRLNFIFENIMLIKKTFVDDIFLISNHDAISINARDITRIKLLLQNQYVIQKTKNAYMILICQFEISFDLFYVVQTTKYNSFDVVVLNKRFQWQINNKFKNLKFVKLNKDTLQLIVFIDSSFVNNKDFFFQIDYVICLIDKINKINILHWSSMKCKRVTRFVLTAKLYAMTHEFDVEIVIKVTLIKIMQSNIFVFLLLCTDLKSLYDCLVRLNTTQKKKLMIDVMNLWQSYEKRKITKIKWINEQHNSIDVMIKIKSCSTLKMIININQMNLIVTEWIERRND